MIQDTHKLYVTGTLQSWARPFTLAALELVKGFSKLSALKLLIEEITSSDDGY